MTTSGLVAGVDTSTQSCKVVVCDRQTGTVVRIGHAPHPPGTQVSVTAWATAFDAAARDAGGLADVDAIGVGGQQHGLVTLDGTGAPVREAMLWNDNSSATNAAQLVETLGAAAWSSAVGSVPVASFTITKLAWLAEHEPESLVKTAAICLPHDWLTAQLTGAEVGHITTDRGDASGTGYWSPHSGTYRPELLELACRRSDFELPTVLGPSERAGNASGTFGVRTGVPVSAGTGDNMAAALGVHARPGDVVMSVGTSGVVSVVSDTPIADASGSVAGFCDATGKYLPLVCTLNAGQVIDAFARLLSVSYQDFDQLAASTVHMPTLLPYFAGERTPNRPRATGVLADLTYENLSAASMAAGVVWSIAASLADGLAAIKRFDTPVRRVIMVGGGARLTSLQQALATAVQVPVHVPAASEYVALGAARQAAWALTESLPDWQTNHGRVVTPREPTEFLHRYAELRDATGPNEWPHR